MQLGGGGRIKDASAIDAVTDTRVGTPGIAEAEENFLADSLARVRAAPEEVANWQDLSAALRTQGAPDLHQSVLETVRVMQLAHPLAAYLRASFLFKRTGEPQQLALAGEMLIKRTYPGRDRLLLTLLNLAIARAHAFGTNHGSFLHVLSTAGCSQALACLAADIAASGPLIAPSLRGRPLSRVAVYAPSLGGFEHAPTALALNHAALLASMGLKVQVFSSQDMTVPHVATCIVDADLPQYSRPDAKNWKPPIEGRFDVTLPDVRLSPMVRWRNVLRRISGFDPDLVLLVGLMSPLYPLLYAARPLVALPANGVAPAGSHDVWLAGDSAAKAGVSLTEGAAAGEVFHYPFRLALPPDRAVLSRQVLGVADDALVLLSVGFRLNAEIQGAWAARMEAFLEAHPQAVWLLVGSGPDLPRALKNRSGRIRALAPRPDVRAICRACDIYVNPPRIGGGFSVAEAMAEGLPVLALKGSDGGAKTGEHALADEDAYFARLVELARDAATRKALGRALAERFAANYDLNMAREPLARAMALAQELYLGRSGKGTA